ncbi:hypothetical protein [Occallatibacter riparius]|uniref:Uncharacterized protein n=1 Tax=Occallatibacter riparius TaxID=1002689 RepID=A0A9J7BRV3_9BACT|nr:hypothetical protein [Occallatibacter riparius]UWZ85620.1 hypothetical protein MOP44_06665 [Occallatibacter riparius]
MFFTEVVGKLRGRGYEVACALLISRCDNGAPAMRCAVQDAPYWLPDGYYEVLFDDQSAFLRRCNGAWSTGIAWAAIPRKVSRPEGERFIAEWTRSIAG